MTSDTYRESKREAELKAVISLGYVCKYDPEHANRVANLALRMFDMLEGLHQLGGEERFWLQCAAILHDIGRMEGKRGHHKAALQTILNTRMLPFNNRERLIIGSIARYHRKALPALSHDHYAVLSPGDRLVVGRLAALLRLSAGMAPLFLGECDLKAEAGARKVRLSCCVAGAAPKAQEPFPAGDLFERAYNRKLELRWKHKRPGG